MRDEAADGSGASASHEERLARMRRAADYPFTLFVFNPINRRLVRGLTVAGVVPTAVSLLSFLMGMVCAGLLFASIVRADLMIGLLAAVAGLLSGLCDALDGDLARYSGRGTPQGAALDILLDRAVEILFIGGTTLGLYVVTGDDFSMWLGMGASIAVLYYYYATDAVVREARAVPATDPRRHMLRHTSRFGVMRLGLYEPFRLGFPFAVGLGFPVAALQLTLVVFGAMVLVQFAKAVRPAGEEQRRK